MIRFVLLSHACSESFGRMQSNAEDDDEPQSAKSSRKDVCISSISREQPETWICDLLVGMDDGYKPLCCLDRHIDSLCCERISL